VAGPAQVVGEDAGRDRLDVGERLVGVDRQAPPVAFLADPARRPGRHDEVVLGELDAVEAGGRGGGQLVLEGSRQARGGDGGAVAHGCPFVQRTY
jgi:hypothetical protein